MKEFICKFNGNGYYFEDNKTTISFGEDTNIRIVVEPIDYELKIGNEVLSSANCKGYLIDISNQGEVALRDYDGNLISQKIGGEKIFAEAKFIWNKDALCVEFGQTEEVDYYPNCDGEHDRWGIKWVAEYTVILDN